MSSFAPSAREPDVEVSQGQGESDRGVACMSDSAYHLTSGCKSSMLVIQPESEFLRKQHVPIRHLTLPCGRARVIGIPYPEPCTYFQRVPWIASFWVHKVGQSVSSSSGIGVTGNTAQLWSLPHRERCVMSRPWHIALGLYATSRNSAVPALRLAHRGTSSR